MNTGCGEPKVRAVWLRRGFILRGLCSSCQRGYRRNCLGRNTQTICGSLTRDIDNSEGIATGNNVNIVIIMTEHGTDSPDVATYTLTHMRS